MQLLSIQEKEQEVEVIMDDNRQQLEARGSQGIEGSIIVVPLRMPNLGVEDECSLLAVGGCCSALASVRARVQTRAIVFS